MNYNELKPGDKIVRLLTSDKIPMTMTVDKVHEGMVFMVGGWTFDADTGVEIDADLGFGPDTGITGSVLSGEVITE